MTFSFELTQKGLLSDATSLESCSSLKCYKRESYCIHPNHAKETSSYKDVTFAHWIKRCTKSSSQGTSIPSRYQALFFGLLIHKIYIFHSTIKKTKKKKRREKKNVRKG